MYQRLPEMKEDPSEPAYGSRLQTARSCCHPMVVVVNVTENRGVYQFFKIVR
jgi:hypothetical protein